MKKIKNVFILMLIALSLIPCNYVNALQVLDDDEQFIYADWEDPNDWLIVESMADVSGNTEQEMYPAMGGHVHQAVSFCLTHDTYRSSGGNVYIPASRYHTIEVSKNYTPGGTSIRMTDPFGFDNSDDDDFDFEYLEYALDALYSLATAGLTYSLPSPWGLLQGEDPDIEVTRTDTYAFFEYNNEPDLMGSDYVWLIDPTVTQGYYLIDIWVEAEAGILIDSSKGLEKNNDNPILAEDIPELVLPDSKTTYYKVGPQKHHVASEVSHKPITDLDPDKELSKQKSIVFVKEGDIGIFLSGSFYIDTI